jgi:hypothetical protein
VAVVGAKPMDHFLKHWSRVVGCAHAGRGIETCLAAERLKLLAAVPTR